MPKRRRRYGKEVTSDSDSDPELGPKRAWKRRNKLAKLDESVFFPEDVGKPQCAPDNEENPPGYARYQDDPGEKRKYTRSKCQHDEIAAKKVKESKKLNE
jgi:hypothetical protein